MQKGKNFATADSLSMPLSVAIAIFIAAGTAFTATDATAGNKRHADQQQQSEARHGQGQWGNGHWGQGGWGKGQVCSKTAQVAYKACGYDVRDNYLTTQAQCLNLIDATEKATCYADAKETRQDETTYCGDVRDARLEVCGALTMGGGPYDPPIETISFLPADQIDGNEYFPLIPGTQNIYQNTAGETITVTVTYETTEILGIPVRVVSDVVEVDGETLEDTLDWYAEDSDGNVWYMGETTMAANDENMLISVDGSWEAGVDYAEPGIIMPAGVPTVGDVYRQEMLLGDAEDIAEILSTTETESAPSTGTAVASCSGTCVKTHDYSPLEPDLSESKFFAPGVGVIVVLDNNDPEFREELIQINTIAP